MSRQGLNAEHILNIDIDSYSLLRMSKNISCFLFDWKHSNQDSDQTGTTYSKMLYLDWIIFLSIVVTGHAGKILQIKPYLFEL